jgi:hypothetical protein
VDACWVALVFTSHQKAIVEQHCASRALSLPISGLEPSFTSKQHTPSPPISNLSNKKHVENSHISASKTQNPTPKKNPSQIKTH